MQNDKISVTGDKNYYFTSKLGTVSQNYYFDSMFVTR